MDSSTCWHNGPAWAQAAEQHAATAKSEFQSPNVPPQLTLERWSSRLKSVLYATVTPESFGRNDGHTLVCAQAVSEQASALLDGAALALGKPMSYGESRTKLSNFAHVERAHAELRASTRGVMAALFVEMPSEQ